MTMRVSELTEAAEFDCIRPYAIQNISEEGVGQKIRRQHCRIKRPVEDPYWKIREGTHRPGGGVDLQVVEGGRGGSFD
jgi:hypothetical protein